MKTSTILPALAVLAAAFLASCANSPAPQKMQVSSTIRPDSSVSGRVLQEVNQYRASRGKSQLARHAGLDRLAQEHCEYLRQHRGSFSLNGKNVSHFGFEGRTLAARERYNMSSVSENVAASSRCGNPASAMLELWKGSKDHHKNMLDSWTHTGMGVVVDSDGMVFATQLFATVNYGQMSTRERFNRF